MVAREIKDDWWLMKDKVLCHGAGGHVTIKVRHTWTKMGTNTQLWMQCLLPIYPLRTLTKKN